MTSPAPNLGTVLRDDYRRFADRPCVAVKRGGTFVPMKYREVERLVARAALQLLDAGVRVGDRVAIVSRTRLEWLLADQAVATVGAVIVPVYPTLTAENVAFILGDAGVSHVIAEGPKDAARVRAASSSATIFSIDPCDDVPGVLRFGTGDIDADLDHPLLAARRTETAPGALVSFLYTSGTTGRPKGVLYDHARATAALHTLTITLGLRDDDVALSFLPMSHALGRASAIAYFHAGVCNHIGESLDTVAEDFRLARPTVAFTVPRVFEKAYEKIRAQAGASPLRRRLFDGALDLKRRAHAARESGRDPGALLRAAAAAGDRLVFEKIRARLGGRVRVLWSGGASLAAHLAEFFHLAGVPIRDVYGMSEFGLSHMTPEGRVRPGSCGLTTPGFEVRLADDGEILVRTEHGMLRYHGLPEDTAEFRGADGWMHTGDIGRIDADGWLFITDRKKSLIVLSNGKKVAPAPIEQKLVEADPLVAQAIVVGEGRNYLVALLHPNADLAAARGLDAAGIRAALQSIVDAVNRELPSFETIKRFGQLPAPLTEEGGELTPTLKVKRAVVAKKHAGLIASLYDAAPATPEVSPRSPAMANSPL